MDLPAGFSLSMPGGVMRVTHSCGGYGSAVPRDGWEAELAAWIEGHECDGSADGSATSE